MPINRRLDTQIVACLYNTIRLSNKTERLTNIHNSTFVPPIILNTLGHTSDCLLQNSTNVKSKNTENVLS